MLMDGYVLGPSILLSFIVIFCLLYWKNSKTNYIPTFIIFLISFSVLGFLWHTLQVMTFVIIFVFVLVSYIHNKEKDSRLSINVLLITSVIFFMIWFYYRDTQVTYILQHLQNTFDFSTLFRTGSFVGEYTFKSSYSPGYLVILRYASYIMIYVIIGTIAIKYIWDKIRHKTHSKDNSTFSFIILVLLISDVLFNAAYYLATKEVGPRVLYMLSYPTLFIYLNSNDQKHNMLSRIARGLITGVLAISIVLTGLSVTYQYLKDEPSKNIDYSVFQPGYAWIVKNTTAAQIHSDSTTSGHYQLFYTYTNTYKNQEIKMSSIGYKLYESVIENNYENNDDSILVINRELYEKHLKFLSLSSWDEFEPLAPEKLDSNTNVNVIYDDSIVIMAK
jgi:hypothetical protein